MAEELGFQNAWLAESVFEPPRPMSVPLMIAVAAAQRTKRIRLGTLAIQAPLHHPLHIAMQSATCDILTDGRLDVCLGGRYGGPLGGFIGKPFGIDVNINLQESRERIVEGIELIKLAWTQEKVTFQGKYWSVEDLPVVPRPMQQPHPPLFLAANSDDTFPYAARLEVGVICSTLTQPVSSIVHRLAEYDAAKLEHGATQVQKAHVVVPFFVGNTKEEAHKTAKENWRDSDAIEGLDYIESIGLDPARPECAPGAVRWMTWDFAKALETGIYDEPKACVEQLQHLQERLPNVDTCILEFNRRSRIPSQRVKESMRLFVEKVLPKLG